MNNPEVVQSRIVTSSELRQHAQANDCWIVVHEKVYDVSAFVDEHPGGASIILRFAGKNASQAYDEVHAPSIIVDTLTKDKIVGVFTADSKGEDEGQDLTARDDSAAGTSSTPPLSAMLSLHDFEAVARQTYTEKAFAFYSSAATDLISHKRNLESYREIQLRPRILRNVKDVCIKRRILGCNSSAPFFVSPVAMAKLAHKDGELAIAKACGEENIVHVISNNASYPLAEIVRSGLPGQPFFLQLYVNSEREKTEKLLKEAQTLGLKGVFVTVDAPIPGKREADERIAAAGFKSSVSGAVATNDKKGGGLGRVMAKYIDSTLNWSDIAWLRKCVGDLPIVLKGIQTAADAVKAMHYGVDAIMLSNHGGRSLDTAPSPLVTLLELHAGCPEVFGKMEIYIDGGVRRGTDILKALALGATAVGLGRPFLYSLAYGANGVEHMIDILKDELTSSMKLAGITSLDQAHPGMVNTSRLDHLVNSSERHPWITWQPKARL